MRGKVCISTAYSNFFRITPAYAGKRANRWVMYTLTEDHPRLCGEKSFQLPRKKYRIGSPPPMRGKGTAGSIIYLLPGITPAYAGKSVLPCHWLFRVRDHPRLCGEKDSGNGIFCCAAGSPPPMRGKVQPIPEQIAVSWITPAYAGKSTFPCTCRMTFEDHPRLCGEKVVLTIASLRTTGSPPPMRGKVLIVVQANIVSGITPAYAGKRLDLVPEPSFAPDHPRLCGEKPKIP